MTRALHHVRAFWPLYLAFLVLLALVDPVARGVIACSTAKAPGGCPGELRHG